MSNHTHLEKFHLNLHLGLKQNLIKNKKITSEETFNQVFYLQIVSKKLQEGQEKWLLMISTVHQDFLPQITTKVETKSQVQVKADPKQKQEKVS